MPTDARQPLWTLSHSEVIGVLVDVPIDVQDGVGPYTRCLIAALRACAPDDVKIDVLLPTGTPRTAGPRAPNW